MKASNYTAIAAAIIVVAIAAFIFTKFNRSTEEGAVMAEPAPYGIEKRPMPGDFDNDTLAPKKVGDFERVSIEDAEGSAPGVRLRYANYKKPGSDGTPLSVGIFVNSSAGAAQEDLASQYNIAPEAMATEQDWDPGVTVRLGTEPSFYHNPWSGESAEFYFTRGRVGFLVQSWSGVEELDAFMKEFPY
jgi:hypothetical protein